jgi:hypothetical protein
MHLVQAAALIVGQAREWEEQDDEDYEDMVLLDQSSPDLLIDKVSPEVCDLLSGEGDNDVEKDDIGDNVGEDNNGENNGEDDGEDGIAGLAFVATGVIPMEADADENRNVLLHSHFSTGTKHIAHRER